MPDVRDFYDLLGVRPDATQADIQWSYERALNRAHRDGAHKFMTELSQAYDTLSDPHRRRTYDRHGLPALRQPRSWAPVPAQRPTPLPAQQQWPVRHNVMPVGPRRRRWRVPALAVFCLGVVAGLFLALQVMGLLPGTDDAAGAQQHVTCVATPAGAAYSYVAPAGQPVACTNGAAPRVVVPGG